MRRFGRAIIARKSIKMLKISKLADYSLLICEFLTRNPGQRYSSVGIAKALELPIPTVSKLLKLLLDGRIVHSVRGAAGGYQLVADPALINIAAVIAAVDGRPGLTECATDNDCCSQTEHCTLRGNWQLISKVVLTTLESISLADMAKPLELHPVVENGIQLKSVIPLHTEKGN